MVAEFGLDSDNNYLLNLHYVTILMWSYCCPLRVFKTEGQQSHEVCEITSHSRMNELHLTLEQHGFELHGSTTLGFLSIVNITLPHYPQLAESLDVEPWALRDHIYGRWTINYMRIFDCLEGWHSQPLHCSRVSYTL